LSTSSSPQDQAILEAEYRENPKPNKAARAVIVEKVDLNEKEVQVSRNTPKTAKYVLDASDYSYVLTNQFRYGSRIDAKSIEESHGHSYPTR